MSYEIVRGIRFAPDKVYIRAASNNVFPKNYDEEEWPHVRKNITGLRTVMNRERF